MSEMQCFNSVSSRPSVGEGDEERKGLMSSVVWNMLLFRSGLLSGEGLVTVKSTLQSATEEREGAEKLIGRADKGAVVCKGSKLTSISSHSESE